MLLHRLLCVCVCVCEQEDACTIALSYNRMQVLVLYAAVYCLSIQATTGSILIALC